MGAASRYGENSVLSRCTSMDMDLTKCTIDVMIFKNMEKIVNRMHDPVKGVFLRRDITLDYTLPSVFTGADLINWIIYNTEISTTENALYMANLLFSYGFFFSIARQHTKVTNDEHCYRFQKVFKKKTSDEDKKLISTHDEEFFRQPRYPIGGNSFELLDLALTYCQRTNQLILNMANMSNCVISQNTSIKMNNFKNKNNNITNENNYFPTNNESKLSIGSSQSFEKPPEIFIHSVRSEQLINNLREIDDSNNLNFIASFNHLKIQTTQLETYKKIISYLDGYNVLYGTSYQSLKNTQKSFKVILRNVLRKVFNMKPKKTNVSLPLYTIDLKPSDINEEIFSIDTFPNIDVEFEEPYKKGDVEQCKNCQDFGHLWPDCVFPSRCVSCGKNHASSECTKPKNTPATCALCQGDHPANYKGCRFYKIFQHLRRQIPDDVVQFAPQVPKHFAPQIFPNSAPCPKSSNFWMSEIPQPGDYQYAVYLCKKYMEVKDLSSMAGYEIERLEYLKTIYYNEWRNINIQAETEINMAHQKYDCYEKEVMDTQEQAFWDLHRPMSPCASKKAPLDYEKLLKFKELIDWDEDKIIDGYIRNICNL
ncbi:uncharacterized protein LOC112595539 [Melanaphis sacchari]|uniref:uncharacterized protein LOC112595539 n=1 Tax=Melanaphis sacchari TaxID=742174 RepID=UPI000DC13F03|nr:uncharacterized protein LOC112595539 [Melanaphis sacchari]